MACGRIVTMLTEPTTPNQYSTNCAMIAAAVTLVPRCCKIPNLRFDTLLRELVTAINAGAFAVCYHLFGTCFGRAAANTAGGLVYSSSVRGR